MVNCPDCKIEISSSAESCPSCGFPFKKHLKKQELKAEILKAERLKDDYLREYYNCREHFVNKDVQLIVLTGCLFVIFLVSYFITGSFNSGFTKWPFIAFAVVSISVALISHFRQKALDRLHEPVSKWEKRCTELNQQIYKLDH